MLKLEKIHTCYGQIEALKGVSLEVHSGEIVTLIGANGAGKSTLLMTICGTPQASQGTVTFEGQDITHEPTHVIMQCGLAIAPEGRRIFPGLTVQENLQMGGFFADLSRLTIDLERVFTLFPRLKERCNQRGGTLSGGEQQMLAIGRALMSRPNLLLLDEPSLGLAPIIISQIFQILKEIRDEGVTIFLVEQNAHRALQLADRGYVLETGRIVLADTGANLLANDEVQKAYLGA
ncbi:MAG: branched-chain amino acid ABC transporter ATP-binding protein [Candidatus Contendobacter odensis]|uniref:High-affinity branched-chain amino acid transport ATP-binding protein n=1 Tax=Candidatus Contendibacter odensensis TaxID=1400860 RepID=A0A2G6PDX6_9GAMM|nr:MAG: branched-chain amino acid ABC transporter ATP-binding protein [Candidatus Contendobacter odensis]